MNKVKLLWTRATHADILVDDYYVPGVHVDRIQGGDRDGQLIICSDYGSAVGLDVTEQEIEKWLPFIFSMMAIAAGYTSYGENAIRQNPYRRRAYDISTAGDGPLSGGDDSSGN